MERAGLCKDLPASEEAVETTPGSFRTEASAIDIPQIAWSTGGAVHHFFETEWLRG